MGGRVAALSAKHVHVCTALQCVHINPITLTSALTWYSFLNMCALRDVVKVRVVIQLHNKVQRLPGLSCDLPHSK